MLEVAPEINTNPTSFYRGRGRGVGHRRNFVCDDGDLINVTTTFESGGVTTTFSKWNLQFLKQF